MNIVIKHRDNGVPPFNVNQSFPLYVIACPDDG